MKTLFKVDYKEIVYCNLEIEYKDKTYKIPKVVWKNTGIKIFNQKRHLNKLKIKQSATIINLEIIKRLGYENKG